MSEIIDRIRSSLVGLRMPRALEVLDHTADSEVIARSIPI